MFARKYNRGNVVRVSAPGNKHENFEPQNLTITIAKMATIMTKSAIQSWSLGLIMKSKLEALTRGAASFSTICRPVWLSFPHILKTAGMTSLTSPTLWPLKLFSSPQKTHNLLQSIEWLNQRFVGPGLQVYALATPLLTKNFTALTEPLEKKESTDRTWQHGGPSSPEIESSLQFLSDEYDDLQNFHTTVKQELSKLREELSGLSVKIEEIYKAM